jgi:hypothetical protein
VNAWFVALGFEHPANGGDFRLHDYPPCQKVIPLTQP